MKIELYEIKISEVFDGYEDSDENEVVAYGEKLNDQEILNAIYSETFITDVKRYFRKNNCPACKIAKDYMSGSPIRQDYLESVLSWIPKGKSSKIESYMTEHKHDSDAHEVWFYFQTVINWVKAIFPIYRKEMKGLSWGIFYNHYKDEKFNPSELALRVSELMADDDVTKKSGIYEYLLCGQEKHLSLLAFTETQKRIQYEKQEGICRACGRHFVFSEMEGDHIIARSKGGHTLADNFQILCKSCNRIKSQN
ncbi:MAG: HNH endonuclease [Synergistaceae bacterium]|nr:HNH endonuclease [Synergistaceae bacterium]